MPKRAWVKVVVAASVVVGLLLVATEAGYAARHFGRAWAIHRVVIDPGHGGKDPGAMRGLGEEEKNIVLTVGRQVAGDLNGQGVHATLTRSTDRFIELDERAAIANRMGADLFVSIHADSNPDPGRRGFTIYTAPNASGRTMAAARSIERSMTAAGFHSLGIEHRHYRVLVESRGPAVLVELGFLSNAVEAAALQNASVKSKYAQAIANGISHAMAER